MYHLECCLQEMVVHELGRAVHQLMRETVVKVMVGHQCCLMSYCDYWL